MKRTVQQKYFAAAQEIRPDGKISLVLLEESKDTAGAQALMRQPEFAQKHRAFIEANVPFRVVITREEPAIRIVQEPSELVKELMGTIKDPAILNQALAVLAKHGKDVGGKLVVREEASQETSGEAEEPAQAPATPAPVQEPAKAPPAAPKAPPKEFLDPAGKVPKNWEKLEQTDLVEVAKGIHPKADASWTKAALTAAVSRYLESLNAPKPCAPPCPDSPPLPPPPPPALGVQAYMEMEPPPEEDKPVDPAECPPDNSVYWVQEECPGCKCLVWRHATNELRRDPVETYPEHTCPWYNGLKQKMAPPPLPVAPPNQPPPGPPPAPPVPPSAPVEGMVKPPSTSGQAPMFGRGFGVPPLPPKP